MPHFHAGALEAMFVGAMFIFWSALLKAFSLWWIGRRPESKAAQALNFVAA